MAIVRHTRHTEQRTNKDMDAYTQKKLSHVDFYTGNPWGYIVKASIKYIKIRRLKVQAMLMAACSIANDPPEIAVLTLKRLYDPKKNGLGHL